MLHGDSSSFIGKSTLSFFQSRKEIPSASLMIASNGLQTGVQTERKSVDFKTPLWNVCMEICAVGKCRSTNGGISSSATTLSLCSLLTNLQNYRGPARELPFQGDFGFALLFPPPNNAETRSGSRSNFTAESSGEVKEVSVKFNH